MFKKIAAATSLIIASSAAFAAQPNTFYGGLDAGATKLDGRSGRDTSVGAFAGYNITQNLAVEAGFRRLDEQDVGINAGTSVAWGTAKLNQTHLSVIGSLPVGESFSVYGRLGVNRLESRFRAEGQRFDDSITKALVGVGVNYAITPAVSARVEVQRPHSDATNLSAGMAFQF